MMSQWSKVNYLYQLIL
uniref:Uncharacterized protein n=1 Tax=Arundo donax TaxID=35708 RepID=A0A0A9GTT2_ARUDO